MISVEEALRTVLDHATMLPDETVALSDAGGRVLREPLRADRDFPPYDRVTMDGIALRYTDLTAQQRSFVIAGVVAAGASPPALLQGGQCLEVMTGAMLPPGTDTVVRYEDLDIVDGVATIRAAEVRAGQNIHRQGEDRQSGELIVQPGCVLTAAEIGVAATVGRDRIKVGRRPRTLVVSTGDELVAVDQTPLPYQIRRSNVPTLAALLRTWGIPVDTLHLPDNADLIRRRLAERINDYDLVLLSGGVSRGAFDYLPDALTAIGVQRLFHKVSQRPGKPFWFGHLPEKTAVFALPGNPVSSFVCARYYVRAWLEACLGVTASPTLYAQLQEPVRFTPELTYFLPVKLVSRPDGILGAYPILGHGSGDLANMVDIDAFQILPTGRQHFPAGTVYPILPFRNMA